MFKSTTLLAAASLLFTVVLAGESVHLANCGSNTNSYIRSALFYYADDSQSNNGQPPASQNSANANGVGTLVNWEGNTVTGNFPGETFVANIQSNAGGFATGQFAGNAHNNEQSFACFKDNQRQLFRTSDANACFSIYYCLDD